MRDVIIRRCSMGCPIRIIFSPNEVREALKYLNDGKKVDGVTANSAVKAYIDLKLPDIEQLDWDSNWISINMLKLLEMIYWSGPSMKTVKQQLDTFKGNPWFKDIFDDEYKKVVKVIDDNQDKAFRIGNKFLPGFVYLLYKFCESQENRDFFKRYMSIASKRSKYKLTPEEIEKVFWYRDMIMKIVEGNLLQYAQSDMKITQKVELCYHYIQNHENRIKKLAEAEAKAEVERLIYDGKELQECQKRAIERLNAVGAKINDFLLFHSLLKDEQDTTSRELNEESMESLRRVTTLFWEIEEIIDDTTRI